MDCSNCSKRETCKYVCKDIEKELKKVGCSLKKHWRVEFCDEATLDRIALSLRPKEVRRLSKALEKNKQKLSRLVDSLGSRQKECVIAYYGLMTGEPISQRIIAKNFGIKQSVVSEHLEKARINVKKWWNR